MEIDAITKGVLDKIDDTGFKQEGAYNLRYNGYALSLHDALPICRDALLLHGWLTW